MKFRLGRLYVCLECGAPERLQRTPAHGRRPCEDCGRRTPWDVVDEREQVVVDGETRLAWPDDADRA